MQEFFARFIDLAAILLSLVLAAVLTRNILTTSKFPLRRVAVFFAVFGPSAIVVHMSAHLFQIVFESIVRIQNGTFVYNFRYYSLLLLGIVFIALSLQLMQRVRSYCSSVSNMSAVIRMCWIIVFLTLPTIPFTIIGSLPTMSCIITLTALTFVRKKMKAAIVDLPFTSPNPRWNADAASAGV